MKKNEYNVLINNYNNSAIKICIEKCCDYKFIFFLNEYQTLQDIYNYVITLYSHITKPIHLYIDKNRKKELPNNNCILIRNYLSNNNILSCTELNTPVVYKLYMDMCFTINSI